MMLIDSTQFSALVGISSRKSRQAFSRALNGHTWRGYQLDVHEIEGRGGRSGVSFAVALESLPEHLQERWRQLQRPVECNLTTNLRPIEHKPGKVDQELWWSRLLRPLIAVELESSDRFQMVTEMAARTDLTDWKGRPITLRA